MKIAYLHGMVFILLLACSTEKEQSSTADEVLAPPIVENKLTFTKYFGNCNADTSMLCTRVVFDIPKLEGRDTSTATKINNTLQSYILNSYLADSTNKSFEEYAVQFISDYKAVKEKLGETFGWYSLVNGEIKRHDSTLLVIETTVSMFTGGAHGTDALYYLNFDLHSGELLTLNDVFSPGYEKALNEAAHEVFKHKMNGDSLEDYQFENNQFYNANFGLIDEGITFYYNAYEIAPYSNGPSEILIPYEKVQGILKMTVQ